MASGRCNINSKLDTKHGKNIEILREVALSYGLHINNQKSKILPIKGGCNQTEVAGMKVVDELQYLGVTVGANGRNIFKKDKARWRKKAIKQAAILYKQVAKSYDKVTVGKAL